MELVTCWLTVGAVLWFSLPALTARRQRVLGVVLALLLPLLSWVWLVWLGIDYRVHAETRRRISDESTERQRLARDVAFWRDRARNGTPAEREAARMYLEALGYAVQPGPAELHAGQLATASTDTLAQMSRHYQAVLHAGALGDDGKAAYQAVQHELARRREERPAGVISVPGSALTESFRIDWTAGPGVCVLYLSDGAAIQITEEQARDLWHAAEDHAQTKVRRNR